MTAQAGLYQARLETPNTGFLESQLIYFWMCVAVGHNGFMYEISIIFQTNLEIQRRLQDKETSDLTHLDILGKREMSFIMRKPDF